MADLLSPAELECVFNMPTDHTRTHHFEKSGWNVNRLTELFDQSHQRHLAELDVQEQGDRVQRPQQLQWPGEGEAGEQQNLLEIQFNINH